MSINTSARRSLALLVLIGVLIHSSVLGVAANNQGTHVANLPALAQADPLRFVTSQNTPIANDVVWVLCYADEQANSLVKEIMLATDANGSPTQPLPSNCQWIVALHQEYEHPSGKPGHGPAYRLYATSWRTASGTPAFDSPGCSYGVSNCAIARPVTGDVIIRKEWPLVLFNVVASLEWEPEPGSQFEKQLYIGLKNASLYLADLTDGYMAFGSITIYTGGRNWDRADLRFHTANDLRPAAFIGGILDTPQFYSAPTTGQEVILRPATTFYGRYWDGDKANTGGWYLADAFRTLAHEWAHYALVLYDEYGFNQRVPGTPSYCTCDQLPQLTNPSVPAVCNTVTRENGASAMAFQYSASELWHPITGTPLNCANSDQGHFHGEADWSTIEQWFKIQDLPGNIDLPALNRPDPPIAGPAAPPMKGPVADLFDRSNSFKLRMPQLVISGQPVVASPVYSSTLQVKLDDPSSPTEMLVPQVYLLQYDTSGNNQHILYQGTLYGTPTAASIGHIDLWGITADDGLNVFVDRYRSPSRAGGRFIYRSAATDQVQNLPTVTAESNIWGSSLDLVYTTTVSSGKKPGLITSVTVVLSDDNTLAYSSPPRAQICVPDAKTGCPAAWNQAMQQTSTSSWEATFTPLAGAEELPLYGVVRIISPQARTDRLIRWFGDAGGVGPGHKIGQAAPLRDGLVMVDRVEEPVGSECNRVMVMPAANYQALLLSPAAEAMVSTPLDLDILFGDAVNGQCVSSVTPATREFETLRLTLFYSQEAIERLGISDENELRILQLVPPLEKWEVLIGAVDTNLNLVSTSINQDGIYAVGWVP